MRLALRGLHEEFHNWSWLNKAENFLHRTSKFQNRVNKFHVQDSILSQLSLEQQPTLFYPYVHIVPSFIFQAAFFFLKSKSSKHLFFPLARYMFHLVIPKFIRK